MILTMAQVLAINPICTEFLNVKMPVKTAYKFTKLTERLKTEITFCQNKVQEIFDKYGKKDENGELEYSETDGGIRIQEDKIEDCQTEINELEAIEIEINNISFTIEELDVIEITVDQLRALLPLIVE